MKILLVVGARPNFMKVAPVYASFIKKYPEVDVKICHTGQHYDKKMSDVFFTDLGLPEPHFYLGVGSGSHAVQTANIMVEFEKVCLKEKPDIVLVAGDVNSTIACSLVASKLQIKVGHIEAGLRSFDKSMPEEINRVLTDSISDYLFVTEPSGMTHLKDEGVPDNKIFFTGNCMIDSLVNFLPLAQNSQVLNDVRRSDKYLLFTFHRPSNVDNPDFFKGLESLFVRYQKDYKIVFPIHPRTKKNLDNFGLNIENYPNVILTEPLGYIDFLALIKDSFLVVTDSGGIQEETTYLKIPCVTVRDNTERPVTVDEGTNYLAGTNFTDVMDIIDRIVSGSLKKHLNTKAINGWDGQAAERLVDFLMKQEAKQN